MSLLSFNLEHFKSLLVSRALMFPGLEHSCLRALAVFIRFGHFSLPFSAVHHEGEIRLRGISLYCCGKHHEAALMVVLLLTWFLDSASITATRAHGTGADPARHSSWPVTTPPQTKKSQGPSTQYRPLCSPVSSNLWCSAHRLW